MYRALESRTKPVAAVGLQTTPPPPAEIYVMSAVPLPSTRSNHSICLRTKCDRAFASMISQENKPTPDATPLVHGRVNTINVVYAFVPSGVLEGREWQQEHLRLRGKLFVLILRGSRTNKFQGVLFRQF